MRYLIFRNDGIGDFINTTPLISKIIENDKNCKILLISSSRNYNYVRLFDQIDQVENLRENPNLTEISRLFFKIIKFNPDYSIVLKPKYYNYFLSKFSRSKKKLGIKVITDGKKRNLKKTKPHSILIDFLMNQYETIDYSNNSINDSLHHSIHFTRLISLIFNVECVTTIKQIKYLQPNIKNSSANLINNLKSHNLNHPFILLHIDEKWNDVNWNIEEFNSFYNILTKIIKKNIIITEGLVRNKFYQSLLDKAKIKKNFIHSSSSFKVSDNNDGYKTIFVNTPSIELLTSIIHNSNLVIELHGALAHISSTFNIPIIDLCKVDYVNYFRKWKPISSKSIQIPHVDKDTVLEEIENFLVKNDLSQT